MDKEKTYIAPDRRRVFISQGLRVGDPKAPWFTVFVRHPYIGKGQHRLKSPALPIRPTAQEAQNDLDKYAASHNFVEES